MIVNVAVSANTLPHWSVSVYTCDHTPVSPQPAVKYGVK